MEVLLAENADLKEWDDYIHAHSDGCVFQTSTWRHVVESTYSHQPFYLMAKRGSEVCGVLPLFLINSPLFGRILATSPYASAGAICANGAEAVRELVEKAIQLAREHEVSYVELKSSNITEHDELQRHSDYMSYRLTIDAPDIMWAKSLQRRTWNALRKADKFNLTCLRGHELLDDFYRIMTVNMRGLGTPVHAKSFYHNILLYFGSGAEIFVVKYQADPIAALLTLRYRKEVIALSASSLETYLYMNPNNFMYWEVIKDAYSSGATTFDFGRSLVGSGQAKFKEAYGTEAKPLYYEYFLNRQKSIPRIHQGNPRYQLPRLVWKYMPLEFTKWLGPHLIKNIP